MTLIEQILYECELFYSVLYAIKCSRHLCRITKAMLQVVSLPVIWNLSVKEVQVLGKGAIITSFNTALSEAQMTYIVRYIQN